MILTPILMALCCCGSTVAISDNNLLWMTDGGVQPTPKVSATNYFPTGMKKEPLKRKGPHIVSRRYSRFLISKGATVTLNCTVENAGNVTVTWTRAKEVLTVNKLRYTSDDRLSPLHEDGTQDHSLRFSDVQMNDSGMFQCRLDTEPEQFITVKLTVINAFSVIFGDSHVSVASGGTLYLLCTVLLVYDIPEYILWYRDNTIINYNRPSISVTTEEATRSSELKVHNINFTDAGNYTCRPSNSLPAFVIVKVYEDTNPKTGPIEKCDHCVLFFQLGATFAFFTLSFIIAFCCHGRHIQYNPTWPWQNDSLSDDLYLPPDID